MIHLEVGRSSDHHSDGGIFIERYEADHHLYAVMASVAPGSEGLI